jgi:hypothetical protein
VKFKFACKLGTNNAAREMGEGLVWLGFNLGTGAVMNDIFARLRPMLAHIAE